jgi:hypothetical protein
MAFKLPDLSNPVPLTDWYKDTMPELPGAQPDLVLHHIRNAVIQLCEESRISTVTVSDSIVEDQFEHEILDPEDGETEIAGIVVVKRENVPLDPTSEIELEQEGAWVDQAGSPTKWFRSQFNAIQLYPIPNYSDESTTLSSGYGPSDTAFTVADASEFPSLSANQFFIAGVTDTNGDREAVKVTETDGNDLTLERAQEGSSALTFLSGDVFQRMSLSVKVALRPTLEATNVESQFFKEYRLQVAAGAKSALMLMKNKPWSDPSMGDYYQGVFEKGTGRARVSAIKSRGNKSLRVKTRTFGY